MTQWPLIGHEFPPLQASIGKEEIRAFARAIGETDPIYFDEDAAKAAGYRSLPTPPTFVFCLKHRQEDPGHAMQELGIDGAAGKLLHAEQGFIFREPACAGDTLTFRERVADMYEKKGGALRFIVLETKVTNQDEQIVAIVSHTEVIRMDM